MASGEPSPTLRPIAARSILVSGLLVVGLGATVPFFAGGSNPRPLTVLKKARVEGTAQNEGLADAVGSAGRVSTTASVGIISANLDEPKSPTPGVWTRTRHRRGETWTYRFFVPDTGAEPFLATGTSIQPLPLSKSLRSPATLLSPAFGTPSGMSQGFLDLIALFASARTAPAGGGERVAEPAVGQTVYFHLDWWLFTSPGNEVTVSERALLDDEVFCAGSFRHSSDTVDQLSWCASPWVATRGAHTLVWELDYTNEVSEDNESNNVAIIDLFVPRLLDIAAINALLGTDCFLDNIVEPAPGQDVFFAVGFLISGRQGSNLNISIRADLDGSPFCAGSEVFPGNSVQQACCAGPWAATPGHHTLEWHLDYTNGWDEYDESNNTVLRGFSTQGPGPCPDADGDGRAACNASCSPPPGLECGDCNDANPAIRPGALEGCDEVDNDCDPASPNGTDEPWYGTPCDGSDEDSCEGGEFTCAAGTQSCADDRKTTPELCDGEDNDCDGTADDPSCAFYDLDGDGRVSGAELAWMGRAWGLCSATPELEWWYLVDYNRDGCVEGEDLVVLANLWARACLGPVIPCR